MKRKPRVLNTSSSSDQPIDWRRAVYIGRPTKWGNPFMIGPDGDRETVIAKYERWLAAQPNLLADLKELKGYDLVCYCAPNKCHGDVLLRLANK